MNIPFPDEGIRAVLQKAAVDPAFHARLLNDREAALADFPLSPAERKLLYAATASQLSVMVEQAREQRWYEQPATRRVAGIAAAAGVVTLGLLLTSTHSQGTRPEHVIHVHLRSIAMAQRQYHQQNGRYGSLAELTNGPMPALDPDLVARPGVFEFEVFVTDGSFTAIAKLRDSQRAWKMGPDGQITIVE